MYKKRNILGLGLSIIAVLWLVIPCPTHCQFLKSDIPASHDCCDTHEKQSSSKTNPNHSTNGLKEICVSLAGTYTSPTPYHYVYFKTSIEYNTLDSIHVAQVSNILTKPLYNLRCTSPPEITSQVLVANLNIPHAPPVFS